MPAKIAEVVLTRRIGWIFCAFIVAALWDWPTLVRADDGAIAVSPTTQGEVAAYLQLIKNTRPGAFAVSPDGVNSFYTWCEDLSCNVTNYSNIALKGCQSIAGGECVILYFRNQPRMGMSVNAALADKGRHGSQKQYHYEFP
jgi:hypothetical protein